MAKRRTKLNEAAAALGKKGGETRAKKLSKKRRREIAAMGGRATKGIPKSKSSENRKKR